MIVSTHTDIPAKPRTNTSFRHDSPSAFWKYSTRRDCLADLVSLAVVTRARIYPPHCSDSCTKCMHGMYAYWLFGSARPECHQSQLIVAIDRDVATNRSALLQSMQDPTRVGMYFPWLSCLITSQ